MSGVSTELTIDDEFLKRLPTADRVSDEILEQQTERVNDFETTF